MELRTEKVYTEEKKGPATTQLTFDETYHLPDYLPGFFLCDPEPGADSYG